MVIKTIENMKEQFINEVADAMSEVLNFEQMVELNNALLQIISRYELVDNGEKVQEDVKNNNRILEIFLSAKQVEGCFSSLKNILNNKSQSVFTYSCFLETRHNE